MARKYYVHNDIANELIKNYVKFDYMHQIILITKKTTKNILKPALRGFFQGNRALLENFEANLESNLSQNGDVFIESSPERKPFGNVGWNVLGLGQLPESYLIYLLDGSNEYSEYTTALTKDEVKYLLNTEFLALESMIDRIESINSNGAKLARKFFKYGRIRGERFTLFRARQMMEPEPEFELRNIMYGPEFRH